MFAQVIVEIADHHLQHDVPPEFNAGPRAGQLDYIPVVPAMSAQVASPLSPSPGKLMAERKGMRRPLTPRHGPRMLCTEPATRRRGPTLDRLPSICWHSAGERAMATI